MQKDIIEPYGLVKPAGYSHAIATQGGTTIYLAGQTATTTDGTYVNEGDIVGQFERVLGNLEIALQASGGEMTDIVKMNLYVVDVDNYKQHLREIGEVYRSYFGKYYPTMTLVGVTQLFEPEAMLEIEAIAVISDQ